MFLYFCLCSKNTMPVKLKGANPTDTPTVVQCGYRKKQHSSFSTDTNTHYTTLKATEEITKSLT